MKRINLGSGKLSKIQERVITRLFVSAVSSKNYCQLLFKAIDRYDTYYSFYNDVKAIKRLRTARAEAFDILLTHLHSVA